MGMSYPTNIQSASNFDDTDTVYQITRLCQIQPSTQGYSPLTPFHSDKK